MTYRLLTCISVVVFLSCRQDRQNQVKELCGVWTLDSFSTVTGKITSDSNKLQRITFIENGDFRYSWMNDDVGGEYRGKYFINENANRQCKTITCISDFEVSGHDTIRHYLNFDILALDTRRLKISGKTEFLDRQNKAVIYTPVSIFRRADAPNSSF